MNDVKGILSDQHGENPGKFVWFGWTNIRMKSIQTRLVFWKIFNGNSLLTNIRSDILCKTDIH